MAQQLRAGAVLVESLSLVLCTVLGVLQLPVIPASEDPTLLSGPLCSHAQICPHTHTFKNKVNL